MKKKKKLFLFLSIMTIILEMIVPKPATVSAAQSAKKTYEISVVYDNSGSMYANGRNNATDLWCKAKYAMETFASMMNYENGDVLRVFPMHPVKVDGEEKNEISIRNIKEIKKIHNFETIEAAGTPFETVNKAYDELIKSKADNKWLIILTDGALQDKNGDMTPGQVEEKLKKMSKKVCVQYLRIGDTAKDKNQDVKGSGKNFRADKVSDSEQLTDKITEICNRIFRRDELKNALTNDGKLALKISMKKIFVFVQGKTAKIGNLRNSEKKVKVNPISKYSIEASKSATHKTKDPQKTWKKTDWEKVIENIGLKGEIASFQNCSVGTYELDCGDQKNKVQIFYEPNVEAFIKVLDVDGKHEYTQEELSKEMEPGKYKVLFGVTDKGTGEDITGSPLLKPVEIHGILTVNGKKTQFKSGDLIELKAGADADIEVSGTYLGQYDISNKDSEKYKLPKLKIGQAPVGVEISGGQDSFVLGKQKNWKAYRVSVTQGGQAVNDETLKNVKPEFNFSTDVKYNYKVLRGKSAYEVYVGQDENGKTVEPKDGKGTFTAKVTLAGQTGKDSVPYKFSLPSKEGLMVSITRSTDRFALSQRKRWEPYIVKVTKNGKPLNDKELLSLQPNFKFSNGENFIYEIVKGKSEYKVYLGKNGDGSLADIKVGKGRFTAEIFDKYGRQIEGETSKQYIISRLSAFVIFLIRLGIFLVILALIIFIMTRKALPNKIIIEDETDEVYVNGHRVKGKSVDFLYKPEKGMPFKNQGRITMETDGSVAVQGMKFNSGAEFEIRAVDPKYKKSKRRRIEIVGVTSFHDAVQYTIEVDGDEIEKDDDKFVISSEKSPFGHIGNVTFDVTRKVAPIGGAKSNIKFTFNIMRK